MCEQALTPRGAKALLGDIVKEIWTMDRIRNGMPSGELGSEGWRKPWRGTHGGACVEMKKPADGRSPSASPRTRTDQH